MTALDHPNATRFDATDEAGHYESFFLRANHPTRDLAFWIRYTIFSPRGGPSEAVGELWAAFFDGEAREHVALKRELPMPDCEFGASELHARVGDATLTSERAVGGVESRDAAIRWELSLSGGQAPLLLLPARLYDAPLPKAKALVPRPLARFDGELEVDGRVVDVRDWVGSQNHNWGSKHTDRYAWGQVAGFDDAEDAFLEVATARLKVGPLWTPPLTPLVLRLEGREIALNGLARAARNRGEFDYFTWRFDARDRRDRVFGRISAPRDAFVGLAYDNPPGGVKHCLNTKIAACELTVEDRRTGARRRLTTTSRAAFELLVDPEEHGVRIRA